MKKTEQRNGPDLVIGNPFALSQVPARSAPMQHLTEVQVIADNLQPGHAVELDTQKISEHSLRKYLSILAEKDSKYQEFLVRTASSSGGRRRLYLTRPGGPVAIVAGNGGS